MKRAPGLVAVLTCVLSLDLAGALAAADSQRSLFTSRPEMSVGLLFDLLFSDYAAGPDGSAGRTRAQIMHDMAEAEGGDYVLWLGHASFLLRLGGTTLLTDPFLSEYAGPIARSRPPALTVEQLPPVDLILISHDHYDHLDRKTLARLAELQPQARVVTALGNAAVIRSTGLADVIELAWHEQVEVCGLRILALPARHFSGRGIFDRNLALWASFVIQSGERRRILFAGDTGYHPELARVMARSGPYSLALLPIGGYAPRHAMRSAHMTPEEASRLGREIGAARLLGMHWGSIRLSTEPRDEPAKRFVAATGDTGVVMEIGELRLLPGFDDRPSGRPNAGNGPP